MSEEAPKRPDPKPLVQLRVKCPHCQGVLESEPLDSADPDKNRQAPVRCIGCKRTWVNYRSLVQAKIAANKAQKVGPVDMARLGMAKARVALRAGRNVLEGAGRIQSMIQSMTSEFKNFNGMESLQLIGEDLEDIASQSMENLDSIKDALAGRMGPDPIRRRGKEAKKGARRSRRERREAREA